MPAKADTRTQSKRGKKEGKGKSRTSEHKHGSGSIKNPPKSNNRKPQASGGEDSIKPKVKKSRRGRHQTQSLYLRRLIKNMNSNNGITSEALTQLNGLVFVLTDKIGTECESICFDNCRKKIGAAEVREAVLQILPTNMSKEAKSRMDSALANYAKNEKTNRVRREQRANLNLSIVRTEHVMRRNGLRKTLISKDAPVCATAAVEYVVEEIVDSALTFAENMNRRRIQPRDLNLACLSTDHYSSLIKRLHYHWLDLSVLPNVSRTTKRSTRKTNNDHQPAGFVAARLARSLQNSNEEVSHLAPLKKWINYYMLRCSTSRKSPIQIRYSVKFLRSFRIMLERDLVGLLREALANAQLAKRKMVKDVDIINAMNSYDGSIWVDTTAPRAKISTNEHTLIKSALNPSVIIRMARRAGILSQSKGAAEPLRAYARAWVHTLSTRCYSKMKYLKLQTCKPLVLRNVLKSLGAHVGM